MALIIVGDRIKNTKRNSVGVDEFYGPYEADETTNRSALQVAEDTLASAYKLVPGQTVGIKLPDGSVKDYQVQPINEGYGLVEKGAGTTDYTDLDNKPTINGVTLESNVDLATPEQLLDKQNTLVSGTNIKTINNQSILGSGNISIPKGDDAVNPFKGFYTSVSNAPTTGMVEGDYIFVADASTATTVSIYDWDTTNTQWEDSGKDIDPAALAEFQSGERVGTISIDNTMLVNPSNNSLAKAVDVANQLEEVGVPATAKVLIITLFRKCAFITDDAGDDIDELEGIFNDSRTLLSITATMPQSYTVYEGENIENLRNYLTVTANYDDGTSSTVSTYTLSGTLTAGTSTITVSYENMTTTVSVVVSVSTLSISLTSNDIVRKSGPSAQYQQVYLGVHYTYQRNDRCCYPHFDLNIVPGTYDIQIDCTYSTVHLGIQAMTQHALNLIAENQNYSMATSTSPTIDMWDSGWLTFTDNHAQVTIPEYSTNQEGGEIKVIRLSLKQDEAASSISDDFVINSLILTKIS